MSSIASTAVIDSTAKIGEHCTIGEFCVIESGVELGAGAHLGHHVILRAGTKICEGVRIDSFSELGKLPMKAANSAVTTLEALPAAVIGNDCIVGTNAVIYRGAAVGDRCLVADLAVIREKVSVGEGTIVGKGVTIENGTSVGRYTKIETNAYITAYSVIGNHCFIAPCVVTTNDNYAGRSEERFAHFRGVTVKDGGRIGAGAVILPGKTVYEDGFVAAGSVVTKDVVPEAIVAGNPARFVRNVSDNQLLKNQK